MSASTVVELREVFHAYPNGRRVLSAIDLRVSRGEFVSLLGPSGCGKSTLLRLIAGLLNPSAGTIVRANDLSAQGMAFVFQNPALMPWAKVAANVRLPLTLAGNADAGTRVEHALALVGLLDFRAAYPHELSGGMQMRVSIARALAAQPKLLLMDEPFAALDEITRNKMDGDLQRLWMTEALTVLFVTHSIYEAVFLSTRIVVMSMRPGRIVGELAIDEPHPRDEAFRHSERFARYCVAASRMLAAAMEEGAVL